MIALQYIGAAFGIVGMGLLSLAPQHILYALGITALSCVIMGSYGFIAGQWGIAIAQTVYLIFNLIGLFSWRKVNVKSSNDKKD